MFFVSPCCCYCPIHWSQVLGREWRCSWSSADRRCSNYIWVVNNFIAYKGVPYIRGFTVHVLQNCMHILWDVFQLHCFHIGVTSSLHQSVVVWIILCDEIVLLFCFLINIKYIISMEISSWWSKMVFWLCSISPGNFTIDNTISLYWHGFLWFC